MTGIIPWTEDTLDWARLESSKAYESVKAVEEDVAAETADADNGLLPLTTPTPSTSTSADQTSVPVSSTSTGNVWDADEEMVKAAFYLFRVILLMLLMPAIYFIFRSLGRVSS